MKGIEKIAWESAGYREKFAMEWGKRKVTKVNNHTLWVFTYSPDAEYQDANGATFDVTEMRWVG